MELKKNTEGLPKELFRDSSKVPVAPYYPEPPEIKKIWLQYYDNITVFDRVVGEIIHNLEEDELLDETIIFVFSDHGTGLPRYKRWLNITELRVPLVVYIPEKYKQLTKTEIGSKNNEMVSFVDFAPTVLSLAGVKIPETMEGQPFMEYQISPERSHVIGVRDRADNMYEMSRAIVTKKYIYIRQYYPHLRYIQPGRIFSDSKESFCELKRLKNEGKLHGEPLKIWGKKPIEELYDLQNDPAELNNLAQKPQYRSLIDSLKQLIHAWALKTHDTGKYNPEAIINTAEMVGFATPQELIEKMKDKDSRVRYWAVIGIQVLEEEGKEAAQSLREPFKDPSPSVQIAAAETLCRLGRVDYALPVLGRWIKDDRGWLALQAIRSIELVGNSAKPLAPVLYKVIEKNRSTNPRAKRPYKDFNFAAFTTWSAEWALKEMDENISLH